MSARLNLKVDSDIPDMLSEVAGGERKRGEYISTLVRNLYQNKNAETVTLDRLQVTIDGLIAQHKHLSNRVDRLEGAPR